MADWNQVKEIFGAALERTPAGRSAFVEEACGGDEDLRTEVESLLASHAEAGSFLETSALSLASEALDHDARTAVGQRIGPYRILEEVGHGGMGTVYRAEREQGGFRQCVAIKLIRRGMDTDAIVRRFWNERQILAELDHPHIARLLDGGATEDGRPYFVMEFVEGEPLDRYCVERELPIEERLDLFRRVCDAVQYAHRHLIVHRDLKPGNILVTPDGAPKLLDFGLGKVLTPGAEAGVTVLTQSPLLAMTPEYASPEQIRGDSITTSSDVYSLGVLLHVLLTERHPYPFPTRRPDVIAQIVCEQVPPRASTAVTDPRLKRRLRGDLDTILEVALRKEPERRYASVEQFSDDVRRHLESLPVTARRDTLAYRGGRLVRRHKLAVASGALVFLTLLAGIAGTTWQMRTARAERARAEERFADVRRMAHLLIFDYGAEIQSLPGSLPVRERLVRDAFAYLEELSQEAEGDLELQRELADGYEHVGNLQALGGDIAGSLASHRRSLEIQRRIVEAQPDDLQAQRDLARRHAYVADRLTDTGRAAEALAEHEKALALREEIARSLSGDRAAMLELLDALFYTGRALQSVGRDAEARAMLRRAAARSDSLAAADPQDRDLAENALTAHATLGAALQWSGEFQAAAEASRRAVGIAQALAAEDELNTNRRQALLRTRARLGTSLTLLGKPEEGWRELEAARRVAERLAAEEPTIIERQLDLVGIHTGRAAALEGLGRSREAVDVLRRAVEIGEAASERDGNHARGRRRLVVARRELARLLARTGGDAEGASLAASTVSELEDLTTRDPDNVELRHDLAIAYETLGDASRAWAENVSGTAAAAHHRAACQAYRAAAEAWRVLERQGKRNNASAGRPAAVSRALGSCGAVPSSGLVFSVPATRAAPSPSR